jgi:aminomethyltransferase
LDETTSPIEAGVGFFVSLDKGEFNGRSVLAEQKAMGPAKRCIAFRMEGKSAPPRPDYPIWSTDAGEVLIGKVVSGTQSPTLNQGIGMGYVPKEFSKPGTSIQIEIRGRRLPATVVQKPFYKRA